MCLKNGNLNEIAAIWVTFFQGFSPHRDILMHHLTVTSLPFLSCTHTKAFSDGPQRVCLSCSVWRWQMQGFALAMPWLGCKWLETTSWDCRSSAGCSIALPCPRAACASWVLLFSHNKLHLTHSCLGHLSYRQPHSQWRGTFRSSLLVCDAHQDMLAADGLMDFRSLIKSILF